MFVIGNTSKSELIVKNSNTHEIKYEIIVIFGKSKVFFKSGLKKKKNTIILKENRFASPFTKTDWYPSPKMGVNLSNEKESYTAKNVNKILTIVIGTTREIVFAIALIPIKFEISRASTKNNIVKIIGELLK